VAIDEHLITIPSSLIVLFKVFRYDGLSISVLCRAFPQL
jgi:hypothetical protein